MNHQKNIHRKIHCYEEGVGKEFKLCNNVQKDNVKHQKVLNKLSHFKYVIMMNLS